MNSNLKTAIFWVVILCMAGLLWTVVRPGKTKPDVNLSFTQFMAEVEAAKIKSVKITGNEVQGTYRNDTGAALHTMIPVNYPDIYKALKEKDVDVEIKNDTGNNWVSILLNAVP